MTDSRKLLSYSRHGYFRIILCHLLDTWIVEWKAPNDKELL
ncbi:glucuronate isomerase [Niallia taxi]